MTRVDPPSPVHTRPYGPGRRVSHGPDFVLEVAGPVTTRQAEALRHALQHHPNVVVITKGHHT